MAEPWPLIPASIARMELEVAEGAVGEGCGHSGENKYEFQPPLIANLLTLLRDARARCKVMSCGERKRRRERERERRVVEENERPSDGL